MADMDRPGSEAELSDLIAGAAQPFWLEGGGTRGHAPDGDCRKLSLAGLTGIKLYEPGALTLVAGAGAPLHEIEAALTAEGQRLAFEPMDHRRLLGRDGAPTIGGVVAANVSGPRRIQAGACRDFLLGVRFVDGMGRIISNGGRVMKNVTGYDLVKLMAGSWGTLGALTEVSLKVLPAPEATATLVLKGLDDAQAVAALSRALGSPFDVTGAAHASDDNGAQTFIRIEGFAESVAYRAGRLTELLGGDARRVDDPGENEALWRGVRDVEAFADLPGDVWRFSVRPSDGPALGAAIRSAWADARLVYDWGGGLVWALTPEGADPRQCLKAGHATLVRAKSATRSKLGVFSPEPPAVAALSAGLRTKFDPKGLFNPGLMS